jgi:hypothetical protein
MLVILLSKLDKFGVGDANPPRQPIILKGDAIEHLIASLEAMVNFQNIKQ